jgi:hypothetical protein
VRGQEFNIVVRRVSTGQLSSTPVLARRGPSIDLGGTQDGDLPSPVRVPLPPRRSYRYVVGTFQVKIPVTTADAILPAEEDTLAIMKWRLQQMAPSSRWYPVLTRYIDYIGARVDGLGGDSGSILPSPNGASQGAKAKICRLLAALTAALLALLIVVLGIKGGVAALATVAALFTAALAWTTQCRPTFCDWIRLAVAGSVIGALLLAILMLLGTSSPNLIGVLVAAALLAVVAVVIGFIRGCF